MREFYLVKEQRSYDSYCRKCRSSVNSINQVLKMEKERNYPIITKIEDPEQRKELVRQAHLKAKEIAMRTYRKRINEEGERELRYKKGGWHGTN